jgi:2-polyprenyl-3-methyl-5-hydroxy-6-metoxy-1,4-benzoquinol methylase
LSTGSSSDDRTRWEKRYASRDANRETPSAFLVAHAALIQGRVLDVAAGAGRNALFLARRGSAVEAIDISLNALRTARAAATAEGLQLSAIQADLEMFPLPRDRYDAVINMRYLQRSLFGALQGAVKPGGLIVFETFLIDQQRIGHPSNPDHLLRRGELRAAFAACTILEYEEGLFDEATQHTYLARLLARRPK